MAHCASCCACWIGTPATPCASRPSSPSPVSVPGAAGEGLGSLGPVPASGSASGQRERGLVCSFIPSTCRGSAGCWEQSGELATPAAGQRARASQHGTRPSLSAFRPLRALSLGTVDIWGPDHSLSWGGPLGGCLSVIATQAGQPASPRKCNPGCQAGATGTINSMPFIFFFFPLFWYLLKPTPVLSLPASLSSLVITTLFSTSVSLLLFCYIQ